MRRKQKLTFLTEIPRLDPRPGRPKKIEVDIEDLNNIKRHIVGAQKAFDALDIVGGIFKQTLVPKCKICFDLHGWTTICNCDKKLDKT